MKTDEFLKNLKDKFGDKIISFDKRLEKRVMMNIQTDALLEISEYLFKDLGCRYVIASGSELREGMEIVYHFSYDKTGLMINPRVLLPHEKPEIESLVPLIRGIEWIEREIYELLGINFLNNPNLVPFLTEGYETTKKFPLRRHNLGQE
ncbi:MAG: NADH-quinone oxidoreductase subunit C [Candidatus Cloacimonetes bacterium]|nr:NADH-quinone oxidoreductase subunit C [Candidatus Cloacimonadota bacterium]